MTELMLPCLDAVGARSVVEIGALQGDLTRVLVDWAAGSGARVSAVDPSPGSELVRLAEARPELTLVRETSVEALAREPLPDALIVDGDHNYFTVSEELRLVGEREPGAGLPLLLFHDVCWPHGRRDNYFAPEQIPERHRRPVIDPSVGIFPGESAARAGGLPYPGSATEEGGERNGVLTAVEDFVDTHGGLRLVVVPAFFGFAAVWRRDAPWAGAVARILEPWDRHPVIERLEANRVHHLAEGHARAVETWAVQQRIARQEAVLRRLLDSSAFAVAERLSRLRIRLGIATAQSAVSRDEVRRALGD